MTVKVCREHYPRDHKIRATIPGALGPWAIRAKSKAKRASLFSRMRQAASTMWLWISGSFAFRECPGMTAQFPHQTVAARVSYEFQDRQPSESA
jgi:hypothetical protein